MFLNLLIEALVYLTPSLVTLAICVFWIWKTFKAQQNSNEDNSEKVYDQILYSVIAVYLSSFWIEIVNIITEIQVKSWWFNDLGYNERFNMELSWKYGLGFFGIVAWSVLLVVTYLLLSRFAKHDSYKTELGLLYNRTRVICTVIALRFGIWFGSAMSENWQIYKAWFSADNFGQTDPAFGKNLSFYLYTIPVIENTMSNMVWFLGVIFVLVVITYILAYVDLDMLAHKEAEQIKAGIFIPRVIRVAKTFVVAATLLGMISLLVGKYSLVFSEGRFFGADAIDLLVTLPRMYLWAGCLMFVAIFTMIFDYKVKFRSKKCYAYIAMWGIIVVGYFGISTLYYGGKEKTITNNEATTQLPYIQRTIENTKEGFDLKKLQVKQFNPNPFSTDLNNSDKTALLNVKTWHQEDVRKVMQNFQNPKTGYGIFDTDEDRYVLGNNEERLVTTAIREVDYKNLPNASWNNTHFSYRDGRGAVVVPSNTGSDANGDLEYFVKNLPVESSKKELQLTDPSITFGEMTTEWFIANSGVAEEINPEGRSQKWTKKNGIPISDFWSKLTFALYQGGDDLGLVFTNLSPEAKLLLWRDVKTRIQKIIPAFWVEDDIYQTIYNGEIYYIADLYSVSNYMPYSEPHGGVNYIRGSVKAVVSATRGEVSFYQVAQDTHTNNLLKLYPGVVKPVSECPGEIRNHFRYPKGMLRIQADVLTRYAVSDDEEGVRDFYNQNDKLALARQIYHLDQPAETQGVVYYLENLPGEETPEFFGNVLFSPMSGEQVKDNLAASLVGRCDGNRLGQLILYKFPTGKNISGPMQAIMILRENTILTQKLNLLNQSGSHVEFSDIQMVPLSGEKLVYVIGINQQTSTSKSPVLLHVGVVTDKGSAYGTTTEEAFGKLSEENSVPTLNPQSESSKNTVPGNTQREDIQTLLVKFFQEQESGKPESAGIILQKIRALVFSK